MALGKRRCWEVEGSLLADGEMGRGRLERIQHGRGDHPLRLGVYPARAFQSDAVGCVWRSRSRS